MRKYNLNIISEDVASLNKETCKEIVSSVSERTLAFKYQQKMEMKIIAWVAAISSIFLIIFTSKDKSDWILIGICVFISCVFFLLAYIIKAKYWILHRESQRLSIPMGLKNKPLVKSIYNVKSGYYQQAGGTSGVSTIVPVVWHKSRLAFANASSLTTIFYPKNESDTARTWSFYIWYLDKNRPLPPGDMFDPFREVDFRRRKAEGFPPPLFCSCIPTPEATPEQQAERDKYWKDEDYIFRLDRYRELSLWGGFKGKGTGSLRLEENAEIVNQKNNPNNWEKKPYPEFENFRYLPTAYAMRYEYEDGRIFYAYINQKSEEVYTPPLSDVYKKEIIR